MKPILGEPMIGRQLERIRRSRLLDRVVVATSTEEDDDAVSNYCRKIGVSVFRGPLNDVLTRFIGADASFGPSEHLVRLTADCPLIDWSVIDDCVELHLAGNFDYTSNSMERTFPIGLDVEVIKSQILHRLDGESQSSYQREHVTQLIYDEPGSFYCGHFRQAMDDSSLRWTVDTPADLERITAIYEHLYPEKNAFTSQDIREFCQRNP
jgi:spore coat polysaccharide biosynthesis protein SpsF